MVNVMIHKVLLLFCLAFFPTGMMAQPEGRPSLCLDKASLWRTQGSKSSSKTFSPPLYAHPVLIMIDPGHGGHDVGTQSISRPRYQEKSLNLTTANFVNHYLQEMGYRTAMTRCQDVFVSLEKRSQLANEEEATLFVSIHYNSAPSAEAQGIEIYYYQSSDQKWRTTKSKHLAHTILKHVVKQTAAQSRGIKHGNYAVIRETQMPAILIEGGFVTNEQEMQNLKDPNYLRRLAWGIAKGIDEYIKRQFKHHSRA